jgi:bifunctional enzyme CysN/CysC/sulfate adenylyltransferase subunit 1
MSVSVRLADDVDVSRGDLIARVKNAPKPSQDIDAMVCWMTTEPLRHARSSRSSTPPDGPRAGQDMQYRLDVNSLHRDQDTKELGLNEIGRASSCGPPCRAVRPLLDNRTTGSFILIDGATGVTGGAGMINSGS